MMEVIHIIFIIFIGILLMLFLSSIAFLITLVWIFIRREL